MLDVPDLSSPSPAPASLPEGQIPSLPRRRGFWRRVADRFAAFIARPRPAVPSERSVAFTIAVIALGAKLAKADGDIARTEVAAFRRIFIIPRADERSAARVFDLARQTTLGFDAWAQRIASMFPPGDPTLADVFEGLCVIAGADGELNEAEHGFLAEVARIFALPRATMETLIARHDPTGCLPCRVLGITPDTPLAVARARWRELVRDAHPDHAIARGLPLEAVRLAEERTRRINEAWQEFRDMHAARETEAPQTEAPGAEAPGAGQPSEEDA